MYPSTEERTMSFFLYGTLRPGGTRHSLVAPYLVSSAMARVWGRLYHLDAGYPALELPEAIIQLHGTADPVADATRAAAMPVPEQVRPKGDWDWVHGDVVKLRDPRIAVPLLDDYEGFRPGGVGLYNRVLAVIEAGGGPVLAWTYTQPPPVAGTRLPMAAGYRAAVRTRSGDGDAEKESDNGLNGENTELDDTADDSGNETKQSHELPNLSLRLK